MSITNDKDASEWRLEITDEISAVLDRVSGDWFLFGVEFYSYDEERSITRNIIVVDDNSGEWDIVLKKSKAIVQQLSEGDADWIVKRPPSIL